MLGPAGAAVAASDRAGADSIKTVINTAVTAEALAVTYLTGVIKKKRGQ